MSAAAEASGMAQRTKALPLKRHVAAVTVGNALEFYDFLTYSFFAIYIGAAFFPSNNPASELLASLATFGAGFATRPLGGLVLGMMGDRWGRKPAMFASFTLMGLGMLGVVFTPSYAMIGIAAPILLICFRLIQGFALGGEVGPTTAFLIEAPPADRRGFYGSLQSASQYAATFVAGCVGTGLAAILPADALASWGWRAAFLAGALIIPFGLWIRRSLPETLHDEAQLDDVPAHVASPWRTALLGLMLLGGGTIATYVTLYLGTYAQATLKLAPLWSFSATLCLGIGGVTGAPLGGLISDRLGARKPVILVSIMVLTIATVPAFLLLNAFPSGPLLLATAFTLTFLLAMGVGVGIMTIPEQLPMRVRSGAMSVVYALAIAVFGGSAQYIAEWLNQTLHDPIAPAYYMAAALCVSLIGIAMMRESAPGRAKS